ncbi:hypothetical protein Pelo_8092 [Pelomyxa schiedti]|nr:hypothetical protein Pelo_8092 [Pelomyxa schiedti]
MLCKTEGTITTLQKEKKQLETLVQNLSNKFDTLTQGLVDVLTAKREPSPTLLFAQELTTEPTAPQTPQLQLRTPQPQPTPQSQPQPQPQTQTPELSTKPQAQLVEEVPAIPQIPQVQQTQRDQPALTPERPIQRPNSPPPLPQSPQPQPQQQQSSQPLFQQKLHQQEPQNQSQSSVQPSNPLAALEKPPQQISSSELPPLSVIIFSDSTLRCLALFCSQLRACLPRVEITVGCRDQNIVEQVSKNSLCIYIEDFENASLNFGPVFNSLFSSCQDKLIIVLMRHHHQTLSFLPLPKPVWALIHSTTQKKMLSLCYYETSPGGDYSLQDNSDSEISAFASELSKKE